MAHSKKSKWTPPEIRRFETAEDVLAYYGPRATSAQLEALEMLLEEMRGREQGEAVQTKKRRSADR